MAQDAIPQAAVVIRAKQFGRAHTKPQTPELVVVTLRAIHAPSVTVGPSPHPTRVEAPGSDGKPSVLAELRPGQAGRFDVVEGAWRRATGPS